MREIKFRAWDKKEKKMWIWEIIERNKVFALDLNAIHHADDFIVIPNDENIVLMQYTGLKDRDGVEIYEGDIVKINDIYKDDDGAEFANNHISEVRWDNNYALFTVDITEDGEWYYSGNISFYEFDKTDIEVIGNKFENPELLK